MVTLNARLQLLRTGQRQQEALVDLFTALAEKARDISRVISAGDGLGNTSGCLLYTSPSPRDRTRSRMPSSA